MDKTVHILVIDTQECLQPFINLLSSLSIKVNCIVKKNIYPNEFFTEEQSLDFVILPYESYDKEGFWEIVNTLGENYIEKFIPIIDNQSLLAELNGKIQIKNYLLKKFFKEKDVLEQVIQNSVKISCLEDDLKKTNLMYTRKLEQVNEEYNQFTYTISHDLHAPLRAIRSISEWLEEDLSDTIGQESKENISRLRGRVKRLERLIDGVLEYSRIQRAKPYIQPISLDSLLTEVINLIQKPKGFSVSLELDVKQIDSDKKKLELVFFHLIKNSVQFRSSDLGFVRILSKEDKNFYHFTIKDNGEGVAPKYHNKIFEVFQTLSSDKNNPESIGIGLALVKKIIETVGGRIKLESNFGEGFTLDFWWPR